MHEQQHNMPPPPFSYDNCPNSPNRRQLFSHRMRTVSSGSTRAAFGPLPVDASAHDHENIYRRQKEALQMKQQQHHQQQQRNHNNHNHHSSAGRRVIGREEKEEKGHSNNHQSSTPHTPGQTINQSSDDLARIARDAIRNDEEWGGNNNVVAGVHGSNNYGGMGSNNNNNMMQPPPPPSQYSNRQTLHSHPTSFYSYPSSGFDQSYMMNGVDPNYIYTSPNKNAAHNENNIPTSFGGYNGFDRGEKSRESSSYGGESGTCYTGSYVEDEGLQPETWFQKLVYFDAQPEFTSIQQSTWAVIIGIVMGFFTAIWGEVIEHCVEFTWKTVPEFLLEKGIFTDLDGSLPLPYYMVLCPAVFGGILSYFTADMTNPKVPGQNEWIESLHRAGIMDHTMFFPVIIFSTAGMASGLSLGPEMPLVLSSGMIGSIIAVRYRQSVLSARVINLTAASAAIGGFFGLPMAGALFVLELPHRMGLQYFEALSPATLASIVSVIVNRIITRNEVKGMFKYPFLSETLPSNIFWVVIIYGIAGSFVGAMYAEGLLWLKHWVHDWFHIPHGIDDHDDDNGSEHLKLEPHHDIDESMPLMNGNKNGGMNHIDKKPKESCCSWMQKGVQRFFGIEHEPTRAAVAGVLAGLIVGLICMLFPHNLFWGEAQLQTMIDRGMTPLPVFGYGDEPTSILTAYGRYCIVDPGDERAGVEGFSASCCGLIALTKIIVVGLSLGTGVCGGHFWAPLFVGCGASHFFTDMMAKLSDYLGFGEQLSAYPCLAVLCIMGSTHVVTFRAQMAIILVLTLSIGSFTTSEKRNNVNGDYSAIFPLLVVACSIPLGITRGITFYAKQTCRGDITAIPEVLCEPDKAGIAQVYKIDNINDVTNSSREFGPEDYADDDLSVAKSDDESEGISLGEEIVPRNDEVFASSPSKTTDMLSMSIHSSRSTRSNSSKRSNSSGRPTLTRVRSRGRIDDSSYQKPLLYQGREGAASRPLIPKSHKRTQSYVSVNSEVSSSKG